jgi:hypothetical protein
MEFETALNQDASTIIASKLAQVFIRNQEVDFNKLRALTLVNKDADSNEMYIELIVLSFIKYLKLEIDFDFTIDKSKASHKLFLHMNLNDDVINSHFCIFMSVLSPDIANAVSVVLAMISQQLTSGNKTLFTDQRMKLIESSLNESLASGLGDENLDFRHTIGEFRPQRNIKRSSKPIRLTDWITGTQQRKHHHRRRRETSEVRSDESKSSIKTLDDAIRQNTLSLRKVRLGDSDSDTRESASDTATRLYNGSKFRKSRVEDYLDNSIPDSSFDPLPSKDDIKRTKVLSRVDEEESSIVF